MPKEEAFPRIGDPSCYQQKREALAPYTNGQTRRVRKSRREFDGNVEFVTSARRMELFACCTCFPDLQWQRPATIVYFVSLVKLRRRSPFRSVHFLRGD